MSQGERCFHHQTYRQKKLSHVNILVCLTSTMRSEAAAPFLLLEMEPWNRRKRKGLDFYSVVYLTVSHRSSCQRKGQIQPNRNLVVKEKFLKGKGEKYVEVP
jgi:hypothetical protein